MKRIGLESPVNIKATITRKELQYLEDAAQRRSTTKSEIISSLIREAMFYGYIPSKVKPFNPQT